MNVAYASKLWIELMYLFSSSFFPIFLFCTFFSSSFHSLRFFPKEKEIISCSMFCRLHSYRLNVCCVRFRLLFLVFIDFALVAFGTSMKARILMFCIFPFNPNSWCWRACFELIEFFFFLNHKRSFIHLTVRSWVDRSISCPLCKSSMNYILYSIQSSSNYEVCPSLYLHFISSYCRFIELSLLLYLSPPLFFNYLDHDHAIFLFVFELLSRYWIWRVSIQIPLSSWKTRSRKPPIRVHFSLHAFISFHNAVFIRTCLSLLPSLWICCCRYELKLRHLLTPSIKHQQTIAKVRKSVSNNTIFFYHSNRSRI